jgi:hypothetical protein
MAAKSKHKVQKDPIYRMRIAANGILDFDPNVREIPDNNDVLDPLRYEGPIRGDIIQKQEDYNNINDAVVIENADDAIIQQPRDNLDIVENMPRFVDENDNYPEIRAEDRFHAASSSIE